MSEPRAREAPVSTGSWLGDWLEARTRHSRVIKPTYSLPWKLVLLVYEFSASLGLAVILILGAALTQAIATTIEAAYGTPAAQFGVYQSWWYNGLLALLALNIFCAAAIRYPWKRYQTGFVITHIGLLTLLGGTAISRWYGVDAQVEVYEDQTNDTAQEDSLQLRMWLKSDGEEPASHPHTSEMAGMKALALIAFNPGPFNWSDYQKQFPLFGEPPAAPKLGPFQRMMGMREKPKEEETETSTFNQAAQGAWLRFVAMCRYASGNLFWISRPSTLMYNSDGIRVEVVDFYSDSEAWHTPSVIVRLSMPPQKIQDEETGRLVDGPTEWIEGQALSVRPAPPQFSKEFPHGVGQKIPVGGGSLSFWMTTSPEQVEAFLNAKPEGARGKFGQAVVFVEGKAFRIDVADKLEKPPFALEGTRYQAQIVACTLAQPPKNPDEVPEPVVKIQLLKDGEVYTRLDGRAREPHLNFHDYQKNVFIEYWYSGQELTTEDKLAGRGSQRVDILQGPKNQLYYRFWDGKAVSASTLKSVGKEEDAVDSFRMPIGTLKLYVETHLGGTEFDTSARAIPFDLSRAAALGMRRPAAKLRVTVDDNTEEFWLAANFGRAGVLPSATERKREVRGKNRSLWVTMPLKEEPLGFRVRLLDFERKLDPGTAQPSHYSSTIDILDRVRDRQITSSSLTGGGLSSVDPGRSEGLAALKGGDAVKELSAGPLAFDPAQQRLYWFNKQTSQIERVRLSDKKRETFVFGLNLGRSPVSALAIDLENRFLYWANTEGIGRAQIPGAATEIGITGVTPDKWQLNVERPVALAVVPEEKRLYWASAATQSIGRVGLGADDSDPKWLTGVEQPGGFAVDAAGGKIYWSDLSDGAIRRANLADRTGREIFIKPESGDQYDLPQPRSFVIVPGSPSRLLWADAIGRRVMQCDLAAESPTPRPLVNSDTYAPDGLAVDLEGGKVYWSQEAMLLANSWITMNAPIDFSNPESGRSYRLFQERFDGPYLPGSPAFETFVPPESKRDELYASVLTVNYDPGRGIWQVGCLGIVFGIVTMFFMRAYFFMPGYRAEDNA